MVLITKNFLTDRDRERLLLSVRVGFYLEANVDLMSWLDAHVQEALRIGREIGFVPLAEIDEANRFREATKKQTLVHRHCEPTDTNSCDPLAPRKDE